MIIFIMISVGGDGGKGARLAYEGVLKSFPLMLLLSVAEREGDEMLIVWKCVLSDNNYVDFDELNEECLRNNSFP